MRNKYNYLAASFFSLLTLQTTAQDNPNQNYIQEILGYSNEVVEDVSKRDLNSKHFKTAEGRFEAYISGGPIHYLKNGSFEEIDVNLTMSHSDFAFENTTNVMESWFPVNLSAHGVRINSEGLNISMAKSQYVMALDQNGEPISTLEYASITNPVVENNKVVYDNLYSNGYSEFIVDRGLMKNNIVITQPFDNLPTNTAYVAFSENISIPNGWDLFASNEIITGSALVASGITLKSSNGSGSAYIPVPDVYEMNDKSTTIFADGNWDISYRIVQLSSNEYQLQTVVPVSWLSDQNRQYPVVVDPTIDISGNIGGWMNGSTINNDQYYTFDAYNYAGNQYKAWSQWNISSIPVFAGILNSEINMYLNGTGNSSTTETITVNDITTSYGNYSGYNASIFADLGDGQYTTFTCTGIGNYGYTDLGTTADADLQTALSTGEFQIGLWMATNGTTWKRFTTQSSTLRVEYESCEVDYSFGNYSGFGVSCFGEEDGSIAATVTGDTNYVYSWVGPNSFTSSSDSIGGLAPGVYYLTVTGEQSWCLVEDSITISSPNQISVLATNPVNAHCADDENGSAEAIATGGVPSSYVYNWDNGETTAIAVMLNAGNRSVTVTDANGCETEDDIAIDYDYDLPAVDLGGTDTGYCEGGSIILNAGGGFASYIWNDGSTGQLKQVSSISSHSITVTSFDGCSGSDSINVSLVFELPEPDLGSNVNSPTSPVVLTPGAYSAYVWSTGSLDSAITVSIAGDYSVTVTDIHGCKGEDEVNVKFWTTGMDEMTNAGISIYPNPASDVLYISGNSGIELNKVEVINAQGQLVLIQNLKNQGPLTELNVGALPQGVYVLRFEDDTQHWSTSFVKN